MQVYSVNYIHKVCTFCVSYKIYIDHNLYQCTHIHVSFNLVLIVFISDNLLFHTLKIEKTRGIDVCTVGLEILGRSCCPSSVPRCHRALSKLLVIWCSVGGHYLLNFRVQILFIVVYFFCRGLSPGNSY